jgi:heme A synthase
MAITLADDSHLRSRPPAFTSVTSGLSRYALLTVVATYVLIVIGGVVRSTDSGTACPDWPLCHGEIIPPAEIKVWIEFTHRLIASTVGFLILGLAFLTWRRSANDGTLRRAAILSVILLCVQVIVGGITVGTETAAGVVAIHLTIALTLFSTLIFITIRLTRSGDRTAAPEVLAVIAMAAIFALIITGAFVSQRNAGLAYPDWPLFDGQLTPTGSEAGQLHYGHRAVAGIAGVLVLALWAQAIQSHAAPTAIWGLTVALVLFVAQALLGAANIWFELHTSVRILHLALASAVWAVLVFTIMWAWQNGLHLSKESEGYS